MGAGVTHRSFTLGAQQSTGSSLVREWAFPALAVVMIGTSSAVRMPIGMPGHRGLIWLTLLVAVVLVCRRPETVVAVGAASMSMTLLLHSVPDPWGSVRYLAAAVLLCALAAVPALGHRRWLIALSAAPVHLVSLAGSVSGLLRAGDPVSLASVGMAEKAFFHLGFGLIAGMAGWIIAVAVDLVLPVQGTEAT